MEAMGWLLAMALIAIVLAPFAASLLWRLRHHQRRRLIDSPRKISITGTEPPRCADQGHVRDRTRVRHDGEGGYLSACKRCGTLLSRTRHGAWQAADG